ncbi:hypothetical protein ABZS71_10035 [Streptomyces sp. NPDC005393]|uniref:hypothetical protein n=1 Tax=Streptomyces sp. NPDC005393 TaxID=3157041 RepID=UPI0033A927C3
MVRLVRSGEGGGRSLTWVGRPGVTLLDLDEHTRYEQGSLRRFPRSGSGAVSWDQVPDDLILFSADSETVNLEDALRRWSPDQRSLVFFRGNLAMPSVKMSHEVTWPLLPDISDKVPEFWVYAIDDDILFEESFDGTFTVSRIPGKPTPPD